MFDAASSGLLVQTMVYFVSQKMFSSPDESLTFKIALLILGIAGEVTRVRTHIRLKFLVITSSKAANFFGKLDFNRRSNLMNWHTEKIPFLNQ